MGVVFSRDRSPEHSILIQLDKYDIYAIIQRKK